MECDVVIDSHLHVWRRSTGDYEWVTPDLGVLDADFGLDELAMAAHGLAGGVLVQAADTVGDTERMIRLAANASWPLAVVGWAPLHSPTARAQVIDSWGQRPPVGYRHMMHENPKDHWIAQPEVREGLKYLVKRDLAFDAVVAGPGQLRDVADALTEVPELRVVVDHMGNPGADSSTDRSDWRAAITSIARFERAHIKLSGLGTQQQPYRVSLSAWGELITEVVEVFGPDRVMWGSDWPVSLLSGRYSEQLDAAREALSRFTEAERCAILHTSASRFYRL